MIATSAPGTDVLWVGGAEPPELAEMERAGLRVARAASLVAALDLLRAGPVGVAIVHAAAVPARDDAAFRTLREHGAGAIVAVYPPSVGWRADRALAAGADAAIALPASPGALAAAAMRLARPGTDRRIPGPAPAPAAAAVLVPAAPPALADVPEPPPRSWLEAIVADVATMNRTVDHLDRLLDQVLATFRRRAQAERCSILLYDRRRTELRVSRTTVAPGGDEAPAVVAPAVVAPDGLAGRVARSGRSLLLADVGAAPPDLAPHVLASDRAYRTRSCLLLPLRGIEDVIGVVCLADRRGAEPFREADVAPLEFLAIQAGQAVENALKFRQLQELAAIDELTGLANRRQFQASLEREVLRARRYDRQLTLCLLDLDHFKQYNDLCGHQAGDRALAAVGEILRTSLREVDVVARYGGEEFAVILPETAARPTGTARNPFPFLERLRGKIEETPFEGEEKLTGGKLTVSGGVACFPDDAVTVDELVREADRSLYVSKSRGRNTITYRGSTLAG